jgi:hypothetical protein
MIDPTTNRREVLALLGALTPLLLARTAQASPINTAETMYTLPGDIKWHAQPDAPHNSVDMAPLYSSPGQPGIYYTLVRWWPGYMSAPHSYASDRLCVILSGTWWINSGADFDPARTVPVPTGTFVRRIARTWHYDGVQRGEKEPVVIAICGIGPVDIKLAEPDKGLVRAV